MWTRETLIAHLREGNTVDFLFFWGHTPKTLGVVDTSCLSQWYERAFEHEGVTYPTAEHFMMAAKARLFGDRVALLRVLEAKTPADAKAIGREVTPYDDAAWARARFDAVVRGNFAKFGAHEDLQRLLVSTGERVLVEAAPRDVVWGIGLGANNPAARDPSKWRGKNLLGFALMETRAKLRATQV